MNNRLIATLAALAIAAPLMGCAGEADAPEQQDGLKKDDVVQGDQAKTDEQKTTTTDEKTDEQLRQNMMCEGNAGSLETNPSCPCGICY